MKTKNAFNVSKSLIFLVVIFTIIGSSGVAAEAVVVGECDDGIDNDGDGLIDWDDTGCVLTMGISESEKCCDGIDNDGDGNIDGEDPGCYITNKLSEIGGTECDDQMDNDGDGWIDWCVIYGGEPNEPNGFSVMQNEQRQKQCPFPLGDIGCQITYGQSETGGTECDDSIDNDNDALIDGRDPGCQVTNYQSEIGNTQCSDDIDNDGDGAVDMLDQGCESPWDDDETNMQCNDGLDNDIDGLTDMDDPGCMGLWDNDETDPQCNDGIDNDDDGLIDFPDDPGCRYAGDDDEFNPTPPPDNVGIESSGSVWNYDGIPTVNWNDQITIKKSLNSSNITWVEIIITTDSGDEINGTMNDMGPDPNDPANNIYSFTFIPYPAHGTAHIQIIENYQDGSVVVEEFSIYIDPSGYIYDVVTGNIIVGANVTLYYENPAGSGNFIPVPVQSPAIMLPNITSMLSDATGHYGWDVIPGNYTVKVSAPGYFPNNSVRIVTIPPAVLDLNVYLTPIITGESKTTLTLVENIPPFIEAKWELWDKDNITPGVQIIGTPKENTTVTKCAIACDNNSVEDIADVEAYVYYPDGTLKEHEYLMPSPMGSVCWQTIPDLDYDHFMQKYNTGLCDIYEGNLTMYGNDPIGMYTVFVEVNDTSGEYGNMTTYFNYSYGNLPPFIEWQWELPDEDNFTDGVQIYPVPGGSKTVTKCAIACDPNGVWNIADVEADVYYPDGTLKDHEYLLLAANDSICRMTIPPEDTEFWYKYNQGICEIYEGNFTLEFWEPPGEYLVEVEVNDTDITYGEINDTFEYMSCIAIDNDATLIDFGSILPGSSSNVTGDNNMSTLNAPTVRNLCNVPTNITITGTLLSCTTPATCDAATIPMPAYEVPVQPIEPGPMSTSPENFQLNIPLGTLRGNYQGSLTIAGV